MYKKLIHSETLSSCRSFVSAVAIALFLILSMNLSEKPLHLDNIEFPAAARGTAESGLPLYYRGETLASLTKPSGIEKYDPAIFHLGLYHPPLYIYSLAAWYRLVGYSLSSTRWFGALMAILQGWLTLLIVSRLFGKNFRTQFAPYFWILFLLNPYSLMIPSIADIDSTIYGPTLLLVLYSVLGVWWQNGILHEKPAYRRQFIWISGAFTLALWAKLTTVFILFPVTIGLLLARTRSLRDAAWGLIYGCLGIGTGILGFVLSYRLYGAFTHLDIGYTYDFLLFSFKNRGSSGGSGFSSRLHDSVRNLSMSIPALLIWTGLLSWIIFFCVFSMLSVQVVRARGKKFVEVLFLVALPFVNCVYYAAQVAPFGNCPQKYHYVFWGLFCTSQTYLLQSGLAKDQSRRYKFFFATALFLAAVVIGLFGIKDRYILNAADYREWSRLLKPLAIALSIGLVGWAMECGARRFFRSRIAIENYGMFLASLFVCANGGLLAGIAWAQTRAEYATNYNYGQTGLSETIAFIREHTSDREVISSMKDVGFQSDRRYLENYVAMYDPLITEQLLNLIETGKIRYLVFSEGIGEDQLVANPRLQEGILKLSRLVASFGNYRIYEANETPASLK